jgi:uncharacterized membrane protein
MKKIISETIEYIIGMVLITITMGLIAWGSLSLLTADVSDVKMKTQVRSK